VPATANKTEALTFRTASFIRHNMRVSQSTLLLLLATAQVRVRLTKGYPQFCLEDINAFRKVCPDGSRRYPKPAK
jgi:hypothetical protein